MDVMQNHTMQVLCLVAMEPPTGPDGIEDLHDFRADVLVSIRALASSGVANRSRRGRYIAGRPLAVGAGCCGRGSAARGHRHCRGATAPGHGDPLGVVRTARRTAPRL